jgi:hypothetical protein
MIREQRQHSVHRSRSSKNDQSISTHLDKGSSILEFDGSDASNLVRRVTVANNALGVEAGMPAPISKVTDDFPHVVNWSGNDSTVVDFGKERHDKSVARPCVDDRIQKKWNNSGSLAKRSRRRMNQSLELWLCTSLRAVSTSIKLGTLR